MSTHTLTVLLIILAALLVLLAVGFLATRKALRRRRRRASPDPRRRLIGAWQESLDLLEEAGLPDLTHATSRDVTDVTGDLLGAQPAGQVRYLGDAANRAIFSPSHPVAAVDADSAWQAQYVLRRAVRERLGWRSRLRSGLRYRRRRTPGRRRGPVRARARH